MSTKSTILLQGNLHIYLELIDMTVHAETDNSPAAVSVSAGGSQADMELMTLDEWRALGFPEREPDKFMQAASLDGMEPDAAETVVNLKSQLAEALAEIARLAPYYAEVSVNFYASRDEAERLRRLLLECWALTRDDAAPSDELRAMVETLKEGTK